MIHVATVMELARTGADSATALSVPGAIMRELPPGAAAPDDIVLILHTSGTMGADHLSVPQCDINLLNKVVFRPEIPRGGTGKLLQRSAWPLSSASHRRSG